MTGAHIAELQVLYKSGVLEGIPNLLDLKAEVVFARADRLPGLVANGSVNSSAVKVLAQVCCNAGTAVPATLLLGGCMLHVL